ncbi:MAG: beta-ketoacyl-ACP synthase II [Bacteroidales bacterium]|nr:beta-ketoacyl-ACP synthase II [Bacteroidales bacterium]
MERKVAVTGMGIISCIGNDVNTFWSNLLDGVCGIDRITEFPVENLAVKIGGKIKDFDPAAYGIDKAFVRKQDKFTVYGMAAAIQAMQDSGLESGTNIDRFRIGVNVSSGIGGFETIYREVCNMHETPSGEWVSPSFVPSMISNMAAAQIAIRFKACGPCMNISTACATSSHSIGEAYRTILHGYADAMITGGTDHCTIPIGLASFANCKALTRAEDPKYACLPFNLNRGGFVLADGAAVLILEEYEHAIKRGARIYATVCGYGSSCDAFHATAPDPEAAAQVQAIRLACDQAGYEAEKDCVYVNAHGTGTRLNDITETTALKKAFGEQSGRLHISSTKSMHGHMMGATGAAEAIATILTLDNSEIPPTINLDTPDPECDLDYTPNTKQKAGITLGLSNSLGFGGHNACLAFRK